jgi:RNA polymerase sigma factor (sigma-70 family)
LGRVGEVQQQVRSTGRPRKPDFNEATGPVFSSPVAIGVALCRALAERAAPVIPRDAMSAKVLTQPGQCSSGSASGAERRAGLLVGQPATRDQVSRLVRKLSDDPNLYEELLQEALLCHWQAEVSNPGQTASWYRQRCHYCIRDYLRKGRSVDSLKHNRSACSIDEVTEVDATLDGDIFQEICERDLFEELTRQLNPAEQRTLRLLREELTLREIARALHISHVAVIGRRRHIAAAAAGLGIQL